ncbi:MAG: transketolase, partial [Muribaculaceae bacterium]|nr:transketolase [Muribaculaceae bacterium]
LVANGSEVALLCHVAELLKAEGVKASVASFPSIGLFLRQDAEYRDSILPKGGCRFGLTAGLPATLYPLMRNAAKWDVYGMERFGASAPYKILDEKFGFTVDNILAQVKTLLAE